MRITVTVLDWLPLIKRIALVGVPAPGWAGALRASHDADDYPIRVEIPLIPGPYLTFAGFAARRSAGDRNL